MKFKKRLERAIKEIRDVEDFCEKKLSLPKTQNFVEYSEKEAISYTLYTVPKLEIFNDMDLAKVYNAKTKDEALKLKETCPESDVFIYRDLANAGGSHYISEDLVKAEPYTRIDTVIHETWHDRFKNTKLESSFYGCTLVSPLEESIATLIGNYGALFYIKEKFGENNKEYSKMLEEIQTEDSFSNITINFYNILNSLYEQDIPKEDKLLEKEKILTEARKQVIEMYPKTEIEQINSAYFTFYVTYDYYRDLIKDVFKKAGDYLVALDIFKRLEPSFAEEKCVKFLEDYLKN